MYTYVKAISEKAGTKTIEFPFDTEGLFSKLYELLNIIVSSDSGSITTEICEKYKEITEKIEKKYGVSFIVNEESDSEYFVEFDKKNLRTNQFKNIFDKMMEKSDIIEGTNLYRTSLCNEEYIFAINYVLSLKPRKLNTFTVLSEKNHYPFYDIDSLRCIYRVKQNTELGNDIQNILLPFYKIHIYLRKNIHRDFYFFYIPNYDVFKAVEIYKYIKEILPYAEKPASEFMNCYLFKDIKLKEFLIETEKEKIEEILWREKITDNIRINIPCYIRKKLINKNKVKKFLKEKLNEEILEKPIIYYAGTVATYFGYYLSGKYMTKNTKFKELFKLTDFDKFIEELTEKIIFYNEEIKIKSEDDLVLLILEFLKKNINNLEKYIYRKVETETPSSSHIKKTYIIVRDGLTGNKLKHPPTVIHFSKEEAEKEIERLAKENPGCVFRLYEAIKSVSYKIEKDERTPEEG